MITLAFDVYGTLIDTHGLLAELEELVSEKAPAFSMTWREKQLEYSFRKGLMRKYEPFSACTRQALDMTCAIYGVTLSPERKAHLLRRYRSLPAFADVRDCLSGLNAANFRLFAFSNGEPAALEELLTNAGIHDLFQGVVSVDEVQSFKPNPDVYRYFLDQANSAPENAWLISSNPFDVIGAVSAGMKSAWVRRSPAAVFDPWGIEPTLTIGGLGELYPKITRV